jgi:hypothetical protein
MKEKYDEKDRQKKIIETIEEKRTVHDSDLLLVPISFTKVEGSSTFELLRVLVICIIRKLFFI